MAKNLDPKCKQCRRVGEKLFLKGERCFSAKCALVKRNYPPGIHGAKGKPRLSEYGLQLREKQKAAKTYNILEKQFRNYYTRAIRMKGETGTNLMKLLELRVDNVLYRSGITTSRSIARQIINHGHVMINNKKTRIPSYQLTAGDTITIKEKSLSSKNIKELIKKADKKRAPSWLNLTIDKNITIKVTSYPQKDEMAEGIDTAMIIEYYSR